MEMTKIFYKNMFIYNLNWSLHTYTYLQDNWDVYSTYIIIHQFVENLAPAHDGLQLISATTKRQKIYLLKSVSYSTIISTASTKL